MAAGRCSHDLRNLFRIGAISLYKTQAGSARAFATMVGKVKHDNGVVTVVNCTFLGFDVSSRRWVANGVYQLQCLQ
jgi:hypothetical protein